MSALSSCCQVPRPESCLPSQPPAPAHCRLDTRGSSHPSEHPFAYLGAVGAHPTWSTCRLSCQVVRIVSADSTVYSAIKWVQWYYLCQRLLWGSNQCVLCSVANRNIPNFHPPCVHVPLHYACGFSHQKVESVFFWIFCSWFPLNFLCLALPSRKQK